MHPGDRILSEQMGCSVFIPQAKYSQPLDALPWPHWPCPQRCVPTRAEGGCRHAVARARQYDEHVWPYPYEPPPPSTEQEMEGLVPFEMEDIVLNNIVTEHWRHVKRQQFPLVCALAMTIHKVQGTTKEHVLVVYNPSTSNAMVYVAFSRVTKLSGLFIDDSKLEPDRDGHLFQHPPKIDVQEGEKVTARERQRRERLKANKQRFLDEKERLRSKRLVPRWQHILDAPATQPRFVYHNVQGLARHLDDVKADQVFMSAELLLLALPAT